jgi:integrase
VAKRLGITKRMGWHTFRRTYTTLLHANGEDVKVVQELLRHGSARITMDVYAQAMTPAKPRAQGKVVAMLRDTEKKSSGHYWLPSRLCRSVQHARSGASRRSRRQR